MKQKKRTSEQLALFPTRMGKHDTCVLPEGFQVNLRDYDLVIINSSAGKDSAAMMIRIACLAEEQEYTGTVIVSHQDLGEAEWPGVKELADEQAAHCGWPLVVSGRKRQNGEEESLLDYALRHGKWPSSKQRWCTSDFKRGPGSRVVTQYSNSLQASRVLYCFGFRSEESPARARRDVIAYNERLSTRSRDVYDYHPIHHWSTQEVWQAIRSSEMPYHYAYELGMPRLSCMFCIFAPMDALVIAGKENPELLDKYIEVEEEIGHSFRADFSIAEVKKKIESGYEPRKIDNWMM